MIKDKKELKRYLEADKKALKKMYNHPRVFGDEEWKYEICLRKYEYYYNTKSNKIMYAWYKWLHHRLGMKYSFSIPANVFGAGLRINHICGGIIINPNCKIGDWCDIHQGVNIGQSIDGKCPEIGSNVYIGPGAKIFGNICIADDVMIGANAVVTKSIYEKGAVVGGVPAKLISVNEKNPLHRE